MSDFPEPKSFNGGPGETGGYVGRSTGPRREPDGEYRPLCRRCANRIWTPYYIHRYGTVCSEVCRQHIEAQLEQNEVA